MTDEKMQRINELAHKSKTPAGLTDEEKAEQAALRAEYIAGYRRNLEAQLDCTYIMTPDGKKTKLQKNK